ncbi:MAG: aspartate--tRNA(Asn) ligase, partial [Chloroflexi bacterium]
MGTAKSLPRIRTTEISAHMGERVRLLGWIHNLRRLGGVNFLIVRDGWGAVQAVTEEEATLGLLLGGELGPESVVALEGTVVAEPQAPGGYELHQPHVEVITPVREPLPVVISKREVKATLPNLLDHAVVVNRHPARRAIFRLAAGAMAAFRAVLSSRGFTEVQTPKIVASA